jgi:hypothetical protein
LPRLAVTQEWDDAATTLTVAVEQTQTIDALNPAYAITIPVLVKVTDDDSRWLFIDMDTKSASSSIKLPAKPAQVSIDPNISLLAAVKVEKPLAMWLDEAFHGPTLAARWDAIAHLRESSDPAAITALSTIGADEHVDDLLKQAAASAIASRP